MNVIDLVQSQLSDNVLSSLTQQIGAQDTQQTKAAADGIVATLLTALQKNTQTQDGLDSLNNALERDHDGGILDDVMGFLSGQAPVANTKAANGAGILNHILGGRQDGAASMISKMSGLDKNSTFSLMTTLAPLVMGALGQQKQQQSLGASALQSLLTTTVHSASQKQSEMGIIGQFLDQDGDGSVMDDLLRMGGGLLGNLMKK